VVKSWFCVLFKLAQKDGKLVKKPDLSVFGLSGERKKIFKQLLC
jgi:hypothetical protein